MSRKSFNRLFDFNGDGKTTWNEVWLAKKIWEEVNQTKDQHTHKTIPYTPIVHTPQPHAPRKTKQPIMGRMNEEVQAKQTFTVPENQEMEALTFEEYKQSRKNIRSDILKSLRPTAAMLSLAGLLAWKGIALCSSEHGSVLIVVFLLWGIAALFVYAAFSACMKSLSENQQKLDELKKRYLQDRYYIEMESCKTKKMILYICMGIIATAAAIAMIYLNISHDVKQEKIYYDAIALVEDGSYDEAKTLFHSIEATQSYRDAWDFQCLCDALMSYENGHILDAYDSIDGVSFHNLSPEQQKVLDAFIETLEQEYEVALAKQMELEQKAHAARIRRGVPFIGMSEKDIAHTSLGAPSGEVRHNTEISNGQCYTANLYDFKVGNAIIFSARCVQGKVTQIWDRRDHPETPYIPKQNKKTTTKDDPYHAKDYADAEDFYDDYYDEFFDYYDAEEYYRDHQ